MQLPQDTLDRIKSAVVDEARLHTDLVREFLAEIQVEYPATVGLLGGLAGTLLGLVVSGSALRLTAPSLVVVVIALYFVISRQHCKNALLQRAYVSTTEAFLAYGVEEQAHRRSREAQERQLQWLFVVAVMLEVASEYVARVTHDPAASSPEAAGTACDKILAQLEEARHQCLKYVPDDPTYNIHILRYDPSKGALVGFARRHGQAVVVQERTWRPGIGHAGCCFESGEMMCLPDLQDSEGQGYRRQTRDLDATLYRAIVDAPITSGGQTWGVLAVTSGTPGQFTRGDFAPLALVTGILGMIVSATRW